jgi:hypothetical protein
VCPRGLGVAADQLGEHEANGNRMRHERGEDSYGTLADDRHERDDSARQA